MQIAQLFALFCVSLSRQRKCERIERKFKTQNPIPSVQHRRSARGQLTRQDQQRLQQEQRLPEPLIDPSEHFSPVNGQPQNWVLKPLFFEVPQRDPNPIFVGRQWLYGEAAEHLASNLPTNKGVVIVGGPGTGKTALLLKLVEMSCFGRGEPIYQGIKTLLLEVVVCRSRICYILGVPSI